MEGIVESLVLPPWAAFPGKRLASMWFKQGSGEAYLYKFWAWWAAQSANVRERVVAIYPEPSEWEGFYAHAPTEPNRLPHLIQLATSLDADQSAG